MNLKSALSPQSIAVVGVSKNRDKLSTVIFYNLLDQGYKGKIFPVNPKYEEIDGHKCYSDLKSIPREVEHVVVVIPAEYVIRIAREAAKIDSVKALTVISAGFKETNDAGAELEKELKRICDSTDIVLTGPNCLGIINSKINMNASFAVELPDYGNIGYFSQSGAFNTALLDISDDTNLGFKYFLSLGNKAGLNENHLIEEWQKDEDIKVIGGYIEQFEDGTKLYEVAKYSEKPIVLLTSGHSEDGQKASTSHTGSIASNKRTISATFQQSGIIEAHSIHEMVSYLEFFSLVDVAKIEKVAIVTNAGGPSIIVTDLLNQTGIKLADLSDTLKGKLSDTLPDSASIENPIDILGDANSRRYSDILKTLDDSNEIDTVIVILTPQHTTEIEETAEILVEMNQTTDKLIVPIFIGNKYVSSGIKTLESAKMPCYRYPEQAVKALAAYIEWQKRQRDIDFSNKSFKHISMTTKGEIYDKIPHNPSNDETPLTDNLARAIAIEAGFKFPKEIDTDNLNDLIEFTKSTNSNFVLKPLSKDMTHKTDGGFVKINVAKSELKNEFQSLQEALKAELNQEKPMIKAQEFINYDIELFLGLKRDSSPGNFLDTLIFGWGGIYTEILSDNEARIADLSYNDVLKMVNSTKVSKIIDGARGKARLPKDKVVKAILSLQKLSYLYPQIKSIDINPLLLDKKEIYLADLKIFI